MAESNDGVRAIDAGSVGGLPYNVRLDLARSTVAGAVASAQGVCDMDDATMALLLEAEAGRLRAGLCQAAAAQCAMASDRRPERTVGGGAQVRPAP